MSTRSHYLHNLNRIAEDFGSLREARSDYRAAQDSQYLSRRQGLAPGGSTADYHYRNEHKFYETMELCRAVDRDDQVVSQGITRAVDNIIQQGFQVDPQTEDDDVNKILRDSWKSYAEDRFACHYNQKFTFHQLEKLVLRHIFTDGDHVVLPTVAGSIDTQEGHRLRTPRNTKLNVVHGVHLNDEGTPQQYWITRTNVNPLMGVTKVDDIKKYPARNPDGTAATLHLFNPKRVSQNRGVSVLCPILPTVRAHDDIQFAVLVKQEVQACIGILEEMPEIQEGPPQNAKVIGTGEVRDDVPGAATRLLEHLHPGMHIQSAPGAKLSGFNPQIPGEAFIAHSHLILTFIAVNLGLPLCVLLMDASDSNFSGYRSAIAQARIGFREWQNWYIGVFHRPIYEWKVRQWANEKSSRGLALRNAMLRGVNLLAHVWHPPDWDYIQPKTDQEADILEVGGMLTSQRRILARRGLSHRTIVDEIGADADYAIRKFKTIAQKINEDFPDDPDPCHWRDVQCLIRLPQGIQMSLNNEQPGHADKLVAGEPAKKQGATNAA